MNISMYRLMDSKPENRAMYYKGGPSPLIEINMGRAGLKND